MGLIQVPGRKIQANFKPDFPVELDRSNRFGNPAFYVPNIGGMPYDYERGGLPEILTDTAPFGIGQEGRTQLWNNLTNGNKFKPSAGTDFKVGTWGCYLKTNGATGNYTSGILRNFPPGTSPYLAYDIEINPGNAGQTKVQFNAAVGGSPPGTLTSVIGTAANITTNPTFLIATFDGFTLRGYINNVLIGSALNTGSIQYNNTGTPFIGYGISLVGEHYLAFSYPFVFTQADVNSFVANPWQALRPKSRDIWVSVGGGSSGAVILGASVQLSMSSAQVDGNTPLSSTGGEASQSSSQVAPASTTLASSGTNSATGTSTVSAEINVGSSSAQATVADGLLNVTVTLPGDAIQKALASAGISANSPIYSSGTQETTSSALPQVGVAATAPVSASGTASDTASATIGSTSNVSGGASQDQKAAGSAIESTLNVAGNATQDQKTTGATIESITDISGNAAQDQKAIDSGITSILPGTNVTGSASQDQRATDVAIDSTLEVASGATQSQGANASVSATSVVFSDSSQASVSEVVITTKTMLTSFALAKATANASISAYVLLDANGNQIQMSSGEAIGSVPVDCHGIQMTISGGMLTTQSTLNGAAIQSAMSAANIVLALPGIPIFPNKKFAMSGAFSSSLPLIPGSLNSRTIQNTSNISRVML